MCVALASQVKVELLFQKIQSARGDGRMNDFQKSPGIGGFMSHDEQSPPPRLTRRALLTTAGTAAPPPPLQGCPKTAQKSPPNPPPPTTPQPSTPAPRPAPLR